MRVGAYITLGTYGESPYIFTYAFFINLNMIMNYVYIPEIKFEAKIR